MQETSSTVSDLDLVIKALAFAAHKHRDQRRKDASGSPYINHPIDLAHVLSREGGVTDPHVIAAALLHDTIEDTETTPDEIRRAFGREICEIVLEVTDDESLPAAERKRLQIEKSGQASEKARLVKLADKICNLRDMLANPPASWEIDRKQRYFDWAKQVVDQMRGTNNQLETVFDAVYARKP